MALLRNLLAIVLGAVTTGLVVIGIQSIALNLFPTTAPMVPADPEAMRAFVAAQPPAALAIVVLGWALGAFFGSLMAIKLARSHHALLAWFVGGLVMAMVGVSAWHVPHPAWMVVAGVALPLVAVELAVRWQAPRAKTAR